MPRVFYEETDSESENETQDSVNENDSQQNSELDELPTLQQQLAKEKSVEQREIEIAEAKKQALLEKRKRVAEKPPKVQYNSRPGRFEKGSDEAKAWAQEMARIRTEKKNAKYKEANKLKELEDEHKRLLFEAKEKEIATMKKKLETLENSSKTRVNSPVDIPPHPKPRTRKVKQVVETETEGDTDADPEVIKVKKQVRKKRVEKEVAQATAQDEKEKMRQEMLRQAQASIFRR
jgi:hypothetical protein